MAKFQQHPTSTKITITDTDGATVNVYEEDLREFIQGLDKENELRHRLEVIAIDFGFCGNPRIDEAVVAMSKILKAGKGQ